MGRRSAIVIVAGVALLTPSLPAQTRPPLNQLLDRMAAYIAEYESQLSSIVADEKFSQRVVYTRAYQGGLPKTDDERRVLESEIGFIRLPGGVDWLGFRDVRKINGRAVQSKARSVSEVLAAGSDVMVQAKAIAEASAEHNLGVPRTTNVPTAALDIIHPRHFVAHEFELRGDDTVRRAHVAVIGFTEKRRPPLVTDPSGQELISRGRIWVEPGTGTIWRVEWVYAPVVGSPASLRVDFAMHDTLGIMVPVEMREAFASFGGLGARGDGVALYTNFRRFGTGARIVPQLP